MARNKSRSVVTITSGTALSSAVNLGDKILSAILIDANWTTAALTFQVSDDNGVTWYELYDENGTAVSCASGIVVAGQRLTVDPDLFESVDQIKVRSGTSGSPVNQTDTVTLTLIGRKYYALD